MIAEDLNAKFGEENAKASTYHDNTNRNRHHLLELQSELNLINMSIITSKRSKNCDLLNLRMMKEHNWTISLLIRSGRTLPRIVRLITFFAH